MATQLGRPMKGFCEISKPSMTAATGLYNVVRQVMGSVGVAVAATTLSSSTARYHALVSERAGVGTVGAQWIERMTALMASQGADLMTARARTLRILNGLIGRQAAVLAYNHVFVMISILFVLSVPLVLMLRHGVREVEAELPVD